MPTSLPIILAYSICSGVIPVVEFTTAEEAVATYQIANTNKKINAESRPALRLSDLTEVMSGRLSDGKALGVFGSLRGVELSVHDLELGIGAIGHFLV